MKKSLIALAALAATGIASAQSSVTLFGIVDATFQHGSGSLSRVTGLGNSGLSSSQLGFRGTEDLGGGMSASFWLEGGIANDSGLAGGAIAAGNQGLTVGNNAGFNFNRRSTLSLAGGWGELRLGRHFNPTFWNLAVFDPFGFNGVGTTITALAVSAPMAGNTGVRVSNKVEYFLPPNLGGFYGSAAYWFGENASNVGVTSDDGDGYGLRVGYGAGPFNVALAYSKTEFAAGDTRAWNLGGSWDFGVARAMAHYHRGNAGTGAAELDGRGWLVGALVPFGPGEFRVSYSRFRVDTVAAVADGRSTKIALGYVHNLSKRTAVYATWARVSNGGANAVALNGSTTAAGTSSRGYDIGLRHTF